jgi:hypothetical protein
MTETVTIRPMPMNWPVQISHRFGAPVLRAEMFSTVSTTASSMLGTGEHPGRRDEGPRDRAHDRRT